MPQVCLISHVQRLLGLPRISKCCLLSHWSQDVASAALLGLWGPHVLQVSRPSPCKGSEAEEAQADESQVTQDLSLALGSEEGHPLMVWG